MKRILEIGFIIFLLVLCNGYVALADNSTYDILQQIYLDIDDSITQSELDEMITSNKLFSSTQEYNSRDGEYISYIIAYERDVARHSRAKTGDNIEIHIRKSTGKLFYIVYFNANAFFADYKKNYEVQKHFYEAYTLYYAKNANSFGKESKTLVPFDSAEDALADVLKNAEAYRDKTK